MKEHINPENLMIEESVLMNDISLDIAFRVAHSTVKRHEKVVHYSHVTSYQNFIIEEKRPDYFIYRHEKHTGWIGFQVTLRSVVVVSFQKINDDVRVTVKMYKTHKYASPFYTTEMTPELARIGWIDHILDFFKDIEVDNYKSIKSTLLTDELLLKREKLIRKSKILALKFLAVSLFLIFLPMILQRLFD